MGPSEVLDMPEAVPPPAGRLGRDEARPSTRLARWAPWRDTLRRVRMWVGRALRCAPPKGTTKSVATKGHKDHKETARTLNACHVLRGSPRSTWQRRSDRRGVPRESLSLRAFAPLCGLCVGRRICGTKLPWNVTPTDERFQWMFLSVGTFHPLALEGRALSRPPLLLGGVQSTLPLCGTSRLPAPTFS